MGKRRSGMATASLVAAVTGVLLMAAPASASTPLPPGISGWVMRTDYEPGVDGVYMKRTGSWLKMSFTNSLEGSCAKGTLAQSTGRMRSYGYGPASFVTMTFRRDGDRLFITYGGEGPSRTMRYVRKPLWKAEQMLSKGRSVDMSARAQLRTC